MGEPFDYSSQRSLHFWFISVMGKYEGGAIVVGVASVPTEKDGRVSLETFERFVAFEGPQLVESFLGAILNTSVVAALLLTILIPMLITEIQPPAGVVC